MKRIFISLLCAGILSIGQIFAESYPPHQISGKLTGVPGNQITISFMSYSGGFSECIDTITLDGGKFGFDIPFPAITPIYIEPLPTSDMSEKQRQQQIFLVAVPGEKAIINGTLDNYTISGSPFFKDFNEVQQAMKPLKKQYEAIECKYRPLLRTYKNNRDSIARLYGKEMAAYREVNSDAALQYIKTHPDQEAAAILIASINPENRMQAVNSLSNKAKTERIISFYQPLIKNEDKVQVKIRPIESAIEPGNTAPDFTLKDLDDKDFTLSSLQGKYVVLDFWGNWCGWCIKGIPAMKEAYAKYKDKVEFVGIDCRDTKEVWKKAVAKYALPWVQVYNNGIPQDVANQYAVAGYPSKYIIDPEGKLVKIIVGEDPEFYTFLDELLK